MRTQTLLVCKDVRKASRFYQALLGCTGGHGGEEYERLYDPKLHHSKWGSDGLILQLHDQDVEHHHGQMHDPKVPVGNGVLVWFELDDFDAAVARAKTMNATIVKDVHVNPNPGHRELWLKDLDGYTVVICSPDGEA